MNSLMKDGVPMPERRPVVGLVVPAAGGRTYTGGIVPRYGASFKEPAAPSAAPPTIVVHREDLRDLLDAVCGTECTCRLSCESRALARLLRSRLGI